MKTILLFTGGLDSTYLAYKILTDTSDELTLYIIRSKEFSPYNPDWSTTPYQIKYISKNIDILKNIRDFEVVIDDVNVSQITFEIDNLNTKKITKIIVPISKKRDLIIFRNKKDIYDSSELEKKLTLNLIYKENYITNVGYLNKVIIEKDVKFILLNSSDSKENIIKFANNNIFFRCVAIKIAVLFKNVLPR